MLCYYLIYIKFTKSVQFLIFLTEVFPFNNLVDILDQDNDDAELCSLVLALLNMVSHLIFHCENLKSFISAYANLFNNIVRFKF